MIHSYEPSCKACRQGLNTYYITCQGCQVRRQKALMQSGSNAPIPPASVPQPKETK